MLRQLELVEQALHGHGFFDRVEALALDVLDQRQSQGHFVGDLADHRRDDIELRQLGRPPATFAGNDLVALLVDGTHHDRLHDPLGTNRVGQFFQCLGLNVTTCW